MAKYRPVFQKVTSDKFRLVIAQGDTPAELAMLIGVSESSVCHIFKNIEKGKIKDSAFQITWIDLEDEE